MHRVTGIGAIAFIASLFMATSGQSQSKQIEFGKEIYDEKCAVCHGFEGRGDGPVGELFAQRPRNLLTLASENDGAFPFSDVFTSIDGRRRIPGHGDTQMPVWGRYFMVDSIDDPTINEKDAWYVTQGRVLALTYYLESIQKR